MDWSKFIAVNGATAHPHYDPDGTAYNMGNSYGSKGLSLFVLQDISDTFLFASERVSAAVVNIYLTSRSTVQHHQSPSGEEGGLRHLAGG